MFFDCYFNTNAVLATKIVSEIKEYSFENHFIDINYKYPCCNIKRQWCYLFFTPVYPLPEGVKAYSLYPSYWKLILGRFPHYIQIKEAMK